MQRGQVLAGRFSILERAGAGGTGSVYRARDVTSGSIVAIKELHGLGPDGDVRFARECVLLASVSDENIVRYVAHGGGAGEPAWLAMEWVEGPTLAKALSQDSLTVGQSVAVGRRLASALGALHRRGIVHRDVKPSNIILQDGDPMRPKLIDLGIARRTQGDEGLTATGMIVGTAGYLSPEQAAGSTDIDPRADVFALGCVLFRCIANTPPFTGDDYLTILLKVTLEDAPRLSSFAPRIPAELDDLVARMLARSREERPPDGSAVADQLAEIAEMDDRPSRPSFGDLGVVTRTERRLVVLVVARNAWLPPRWPAFDDIAQTLDVVPEVLVDGTLVLVVDGESASAGDLARRAARAALAVKKAVPSARIAIATGRAARRGPIVGEAIDRAGNLVADLERAGVAGEISVDQHAARLLADRFVLRPRETAMLLTGEHAGAGLGAGNLDAPFLGRERELGYAKSLVDQCFSERHARPILVYGGPGSGKSRLARELVGALDGIGVETWVAPADPLAQKTPFGMLVPLLFRLAGIARGEPPGESAHKLEQMVGMYVHGLDRMRISAFLGEIAGIDDSGAPTAAMAAARRDAALMGDQMRAALTDFIGAVTQKGPLLLALEDLQWADQATLGFLDNVVRALEDAPLCVLGLGRPEAKRAFPALFSERGVHEIRLEPLSRGAMLGLARALASPNTSASMLERIAERADGNPFFLEELVRAAPHDDDTSLPGSVLAVLDARLDGLPVETRRVLRAASVFGKAFWEDGVRALVPKVDVARHLSELERADVVRRSPTSRFEQCAEWAFRHGLVADAAYARLAETDVARAHLAAARWLEGVGESDPTLLAEHYERGGDAKSAIGLLASAAHLALEASDLDHAVSLVGRALRSGATGNALGELQADAAEAHLWRGDNEAALVAGRTALDALPPGSATWCRAAAAAVVAAGRTHDDKSLSQLVASILAEAPAATPSPDWVVLLTQAAMRLVFAGDLAGADRLLQRMPAGLAQLDRVQQAWMLRARGWRALAAGDLGAYKALMHGSALEFREVGDTRNACVQRLNEAYGAMCVGCVTEAEAGLTEVLRVAERLGLGTVATTAKHNLGLVLARLGRVDEGERYEREAIDEFRHHKDPRLQAGSMVYLAEILLTKGDAAGAEANAVDAVSIAPANAPIRAYCLARLAIVLLRRGGEGRSERALTAAQEAKTRLESIGGIDEGDGLIRFAFAWSLHAADRVDEAKAAAAAARARLQERAARITPASLQRGFLEDVPEHAATFDLARRIGA